MREKSGRVRYECFHNRFKECEGILGISSQKRGKGESFLLEDLNTETEGKG